MESFFIDMSAEKNKYIALGVMSGTSLDGLDISLCNYYCENRIWGFDLIDSVFIEYNSEIRNRLRKAYDTTARELVEIDIEFGRYIGEKIIQFINKRKIIIDLIASHGQTIFHSPSEGYTKQIGSGAVISAITRLPVVSDFRQQDVTLGGQGAPLVPAGDALLFQQYGACLNLGGFANISYNLFNNRIAYDICAVNFVLNRLVGQKELEFDCDGVLSAGGKIIQGLLNELEQIDFYKKEPPKSLGQEWTENVIFPILKNYSIQPLENLLRTYSEHICLQLVKVLSTLSSDNILITGGGAKNKFLIKRISELTTKEIVIPSAALIDFKEAIVFGFLGVLRMRNEINCFASVTGAAKDSCTGAVYLP